MPKSNTSKIMMLNFLTRNQSVTQPIQLYVALYSTNPTDANTGTEINYTGYTRQPVIFGSPQLSGGNAIVQNTAQITFQLITENAGNIAYVGLLTAATGGDLIYHGPLSATYVANKGVQPIIPVGSLTVAEN